MKLVRKAGLILYSLSSILYIHEYLQMHTWHVHISPTSNVQKTTSPSSWSHGSMPNEILNSFFEENTRYNVYKLTEKIMNFPSYHTIILYLKMRASSPTNGDIENTSWRKKT